MVDGGRALRIPCRTLFPDTLGLLGCHAGPTVSPGGEKNTEQYLHCQGIAMQIGKHNEIFHFIFLLSQSVHPRSFNSFEVERRMGGRGRESHLNATKTTCFILCFVFIPVIVSIRIFFHTPNKAIKEMSSFRNS